VKALHCRRDGFKDSMFNEASLSLKANAKCFVLKDPIPASCEWWMKLNVTLRVSWLSVASVGMLISLSRPFSL